MMNDNKPSDDDCRCPHCGSEMYICAICGGIMEDIDGQGWICGDGFRAHEICHFFAGYDGVDVFMEFD